MNVVIRRP